MWIRSLACMIFAGSIASLTAQTTGPSSPPATQPLTSTIEKHVTMTGCVEAFDESAKHFTLSDSESGIKYRLTGKDVKTFLGIKVRIVGGLVPTTNLAAQAGAIDPARAAVATASGQGSNLSYIALPELRIGSVKRTTGACVPTKK
jgi:hypothetical protein